MPRRVNSPSVTYHAGTSHARSAKKKPQAASLPTTKLAAKKPTPRTATLIDRNRQITAKLFSNGRSQAVRLPKEFRMPGTEVRIHREGERVILEPVADEPLDAKGWPIGLWDELARLREGLDLGDFQIEDDPVPTPIVPLDQR